MITKLYLLFYLYAIKQYENYEMKKGETKKVTCTRTVDGWRRGKYNEDTKLNELSYFANRSARLSVNV